MVETRRANRRNRLVRARQREMRPVIRLLHERVQWIRELPLFRNATAGLAMLDRDIANMQSAAFVPNVEFDTIENVRVNTAVIQRDVEDIITHYITNDPHDIAGLYDNIVGFLTAPDMEAQQSAWDVVLEVIDLFEDSSPDSSPGSTPRRRTQPQPSRHRRTRRFL